MTYESKWMRGICTLAARYYLKRPDQAELLFIKYPRLRELWPALLNELSYRLGLSRSFRLTGLNVELTNRCNLSCTHCLKREPGGRVEQDMDFSTFRAIVNMAPSINTLLPFQWGEPLLNPMVYDCISYAAERGIRVMLTTNGTLLDEDAARRLIASGLSRLTVSFDGDKDTHAALRQVDPDRVISNAARFREIRDRMGASCALDASMVVDETTEPSMRGFKDLFEGIADRLQYIPRFVQGERKVPCRELWRGVLVVLSSGDVTLCCADAAGKGTIGNVANQTLKELFNGKAMREIRKQHRRRDFPVLCRECAEYCSHCVSPRFS